MRGAGKGESLLENGLSHAEWERPITRQQAEQIVEVSCQILDTPEPQLVFGSNGKLRGNYRYKQHRIYVACPVKGIILHELAHHISYIKEGRRCLHDPDFAYWLDRLISMWESI